MQANPARPAAVVGRGRSLNILGIGIIITRGSRYPGAGRIADYPLFERVDNFRFASGDLW